MPCVDGVQCVISPDIFRLRPDFAALSISVLDGRNALDGPYEAERLRRACAEVDAAPWAIDHLEAWREAYRAFGAKPQRTPSSVDALAKRARRDGTLPSVNAVVDLYNAVSLQYALPVGGEDMNAYAGTPRLIVTSGEEPFDTMHEGLPRTETVDAGEVVWCDDLGVTCRRWNWRQGVRTRITENSTAMWFVLERLAPMPLDALMEAGDALVDGLKRLSPSLEVKTGLLTMSA